MDTKAIGQRICIAREERCMSQQRLANAIGCSDSYISAIERGEKSPNLETFVAIASALRVPADVLLQDVLSDWWETWEKEIDRVLAPLLPHNRAYPIDKFGRFTMLCHTNYFCILKGCKTTYSVY